DLALTATFTDDAGNVASDVPLDIVVVDGTAPAPATSDAFVLVREPWANPPATTLSQVKPVEPGAHVIVTSDAGGKVVLTLGKVAGTNGFVGLKSINLGSADVLHVFVDVVDTADNASPIVAVANSEWHAGPRGAGNPQGPSNPHRVVTIGDFSPFSPLPSSATLLGDAAADVDGDAITADERGAWSTRAFVASPGASPLFQGDAIVAVAEDPVAHALYALAFDPNFTNPPVFAQFSDAGFTPLPTPTAPPFGTVNQAALGVDARTRRVYAFLDDVPSTVAVQVFDGTAWRVLTTTS